MLLGWRWELGFNLLRVGVVHEFCAFDFEFEIVVLYIACGLGFEFGIMVYTS